MRNVDPSPPRLALRVCRLGRAHRFAPAPSFERYLERRLDRLPQRSAAAAPENRGLPPDRSMHAVATSSSSVPIARASSAASTFRNGARSMVMNGPPSVELRQARSSGSLSVRALITSMAGQSPTAAVKPARNSRITGSAPVDIFNHSEDGCLFAGSRNKRGNCFAHLLNAGRLLHGTVDCFQFRWLRQPQQIIEVTLAAPRRPGRLRWRGWLRLRWLRELCRRSGERLLRPHVPGSSPCRVPKSKTDPLWHENPSRAAAVINLSIRRVLPIPASPRT